MRKKKDPPTRVLCRYGIEDRSPDVSFHKVSVVLVETFAWAAVMVHNLKSFSYLEIVVQSSFVFVLEGCEDFGVIPVNGGVTVLFVGGYARVTPILGFDCSLMLASSSYHFSFCFTDVLFVRNWAFKTIHPILFILWWAPFVFSR